MQHLFRFTSLYLNSTWAILTCLRSITLHDTLYTICPMVTALNFVTIFFWASNLQLYSALLSLFYPTKHDKKYVWIRKIYTQYNVDMERFPIKQPHLARTILLFDKAMSNAVLTYSYVLVEQVWSDQRIVLNSWNL